MDLGNRIVTGFNEAVGDLVEALPAIIGALLIIVIGWILSGIVGRVVTELLRRLGADRLFAQHATGVYGQAGAQLTPSRVAGSVVKWLVRLVTLIAAANSLGLTQLSVLLNEVVLWLPNLLVAALILLLAPLIARFVRGLIEVGAGQLGFTNAPLLGRVAEIAIVAFAVLVAVRQAGVATNLIDTLFIGLVAALALAFGLAFGLGGRDVASEITRNWYESSRETRQRVAERARTMAESEPPRVEPAQRPEATGGTATAPARPR